MINKVNQLTNKNNELLSIIEKFNNLIIKKTNDSYLSTVKSILTASIKMNNCNYDTIKNIGKTFESDITMKTNNEAVLNVCNNIARSLDAVDNMYLKLSKSLNDFNNDFIIFSRQSGFINFVNKSFSTVSYCIKQYIKALEVIIDAYDRCIKHVSSNNKSIVSKRTNTVNWQVINKHGFSVNKMYISTQNGLARSKAYDNWINEMLCTMKNYKIQSLKSMGINPNKPMKLEVEFKLVRGSDTDNPLKSFIDLLVRYYELTDDNNFVDIHVSRNPVWANSYSDGQIKFKITNI